MFFWERALFLVWVENVYDFMSWKKICISHYIKHGEMNVKLDYEWGYKTIYAIVLG